LHRKIISSVKQNTLVFHTINGVPTRNVIPEHYAAEGNVEDCGDYSEERADAVWYISFLYLNGVFWVFRLGRPSNL